MSTNNYNIMKFSSNFQYAEMAIVQDDVRKIKAL